MTPHDLALALHQTSETARLARAHWESSQRQADVAEQDAALVTVRHATALKRALEQWIAARTLREQLHVTT